MNTEMALKEYIDKAGDDEFTDLDVFAAAMDLEIDPEDVAETYSGKYDSDVLFAQEMAEQCTVMDELANWPQRCIDWAQAAREIMYDYSQSNGHYFLNI